MNYKLLITITIVLPLMLLLPLRNLFPPILSTLKYSAMASNASTPYSMVFVTAPSQEVAKKIAGGLVSEKMAACVNLIPSVISVYEWEGKIENDEEVLMMIKTRTEKISELTNFVNKNHPYDVVEVISTSIEQGNAPYLDWIGKIVPSSKNK